MITGTWDRFWAAFVLWLAIIVMLEFMRRLPANRLSWWIVHGPAVAWGAVALFPWFIALRSGFWQVPSQPLNTVPLSLPATYGFSLLALIGLVVGIAPFALVGRRAVRGEPVHARISIVPARAFLAISLLFAIYVISLPSLSDLRAVAAPAGENLYSGTDGSFLSLSLVVLSGMTIGYLASRHVLSWVGIVLFLALLVVTLGSAHRYLILILILSYLILRRPNRRAGGSPIQGLVLLILCAVTVWLIGFSGLGQLSILRSGTSAATPSVYTQRTLQSFDVISSAEYLLESGVQPGQLHGASYLALPDELIPRFLLGARSTPPAVQVEGGELGEKVGASAPLWIEGVLNLGAVGDVLSMIVVAGSWGLFLRKATSSRGELGRAVAALGPVWILFAYQALSRILLIATIDLFASVVIGLLLWNWIHVEEDASAAMPVSEPQAARRHRDLADGGATRSLPGLTTLHLRTVKTRGVNATGSLTSCPTGTGWLPECN
jgi:hypothetical protein